MESMAGFCSHIPNIISGLLVLILRSLDKRICSFPVCSLVVNSVFAKQNFVLLCTRGMPLDTFGPDTLYYRHYR